tara:strand:+ start:3095 stop:4423 length:1329 start_codon:yes stop_codon:yes gene_type:complete
MIQAIQLLLSLSILVVLHEFGHYITAKLFGCRVEKFYLFMDWKFALFKKKIGETEFGLGWLPLGGYVKIAGFIDESMDAKGMESEPEKWELRAKPAWQRLIVMLGGIIVNILLAWFIYSMILFSWGEEYTPTSGLKNGVSFNSAGEKLGFQDGDLILSIDDVDIVEFDAMMIMSTILFEGAKKVVVKRRGEEKTINLDGELVKNIIRDLKAEDGPLILPNYEWVVGSLHEDSNLKKDGLKPGDQLLAIDDIEARFLNHKAIDYLKKSKGKIVMLTVKKDFTNNIEKFKTIVNQDGKLGFNYSFEEYTKIRSFSFFSCFGAGWSKTVDMTKMYWGQLKTIFNPTTGGYKHVGGVISIGKMFPDNWNWFVFWSMTALLSIILAIMNLLPIPALDGGHALIAVVEMVSGKKLPISILMPLQFAGMILLFALLIYANGMDVVRLFN